jgi:hypothetical protein
MRIATVLETVSRAARAGEDIGAALRNIMPLDMLDADAAIIRRTAAPHRDDVLSEIAAEYRTFKRAGPQFLQALDCPSSDALAHICALISGEHCSSYV